MYSNLNIDRSYLLIDDEDFNRCSKTILKMEILCLDLSDLVWIECFEIKGKRYFKFLYTYTEMWYIKT